LLDIGHLLARWTEPGERPVLTLQAGHNDGYPTRAEMANRYAVRTGRDLRALAFYEVLALFKLAVILEGRHAQESASGVPAADTSMAAIVPDLLQGAAEFARGERT
ncbi:MAG: phosphotransferase family protein, partial [Mycobacterium sp.]